MAASDDDQIRRMELMVAVEREEGFIREYLRNAEFYRLRVQEYYRELGRIEERLDRRGDTR